MQAESLPAEPQWACRLLQPSWRTVWRFLKKLKIELPYDSAKKLKIELPYDLAIPLLGICPEKSMTPKDICTPMFFAALFSIAKLWKQPKCPSTEEWIKKVWHIHPMQHYSPIK